MIRANQIKTHEMLLTLRTLPRTVELDATQLRAAFELFRATEQAMDKGAEDSTPAPREMKFWGDR